MLEEFGKKRISRKHSEKIDGIRRMIHVNKTVDDNCLLDHLL
jgi:hypothetical protein